MMFRLQVRYCVNVNGHYTDKALFINTNIRCIFYLFVKTMNLQQFFDIMLTDIMKL